MDDTGRPKATFPQKSSCRVTCCVSNCINNALAIDERTGQYVRMHTFPDPEKEKERCQQWIINICRTDLHLNNIQSKRVCSVHFEVCAYNCPSDIAHSRLLWTAVPTIITCPKPSKPLAIKRKPSIEKRKYDKLKTLKTKKFAQNVTSEISHTNNALNKHSHDAESNKKRKNVNNEKVTLFSLLKKQQTLTMNSMKRKEQNHIMEFEEVLWDSSSEESYFNKQSKDTEACDCIKQGPDFGPPTPSLGKEDDSNGVIRPDKARSENDSDKLAIISEAGIKEEPGEYHNIDHKGKSGEDQVGRLREYTSSSGHKDNDQNLLTRNYVQDGCVNIKTEPDDHTCYSTIEKKDNYSIQKARSCMSDIQEAGIMCSKFSYHQGHGAFALKDCSDNIHDSFSKIDIRFDSVENNGLNDQSTVKIESINSILHESQQSSSLAIGMEASKKYLCFVQGQIYQRSQTNEACDISYDVCSPRNNPQRLEGTNIEKPCKCDICGAGFKRTRSLEAHKRRHTGERPYMCSICGKEFFVTSTLVVHMRIHTGEKPYKCEICGADFNQKATLWRHKKMHTGEKSYVCEICGAGFGQSSGLSSHQKIHTAEKPYICDICNVGFSQSSNLLRHKRIHTGEKPYKCDTCGVGFSQICTLQKHKRIHTGEKPYNCDLCDAKFSQKSGLWSHSKVHTGEKPYKCDFCGARFSQRSTLSSHKKLHTGEKGFKPKSKKTKAKLDKRDGVDADVPLSCPV